ncbi:hypothetical protein [Kribbella sp. HUAS MG21]|uniref:Uncharacterized protein n=1 Tax=Kribbella sp. HUAS MG21 TaxID=3160966 RepID=A0AAU7T8B2_9ACTN
METSEFAAELRHRVRVAIRALDAAQVEGDGYAVDIRAGELESLRRIARENGVTLDDESDNDGDNDGNDGNGQAGVR